MTPRSRLILVLAAAAVLIGAFILAQGSGDDDTDAASTTRTVATTTPATTTSADHTGHDATTVTATTTAPANPKVPTVVIEGGKPVGGVRDIEVAKGDDVRFTVRSDVADEIHVHGYDLMKDVRAGGSVSFHFPATIDGKFEVELEDAGEQIVSLTVKP